jgi:hypothetical protein
MYITGQRDGNVKLGDEAWVYEVKNGQLALNRGWLGVRVS